LKRSKVDFRLLVITDSYSANNNFVKIIKECCENGVKAIQLREKNLPAAELVELAKKIKSVTKKYKSMLIVNDRLDIVLLADAEGIHSSESGIGIKFLSKYKKLIIGKSVHSVEQARKAEKEEYDYILFGPVFRTPSKINYGAPQGLNKLNKICSTVNIPVFAVGGVTPTRTAKCIIAGAYGVAVIRAVMKSHSIKKTVNEFKSELGGL
jgi:thiamine-phosphate pyrophosphorylase